MGGLSSALGPVLQIGSALGTVAGAMQPYYENSLSQKQTKRENELALQQAQAKAALDKEAGRLSDLKEEEKRRVSLKRAMARQRASFGGQGLSSTDGSSEAVLLGLFNESDEERAIREQMSALRENAIDLNAAQIQQRNLLELTSDREKQDLKRLTEAF